MSFHIITHTNRTRDFAGTLYEEDGTTRIALSALDVVRFKVGSHGDGPLLEIDSNEATENGSLIRFTVGGGDTAGNYTMRIAQGDAAELGAGVFDCEISVVEEDESDAPNEAIKTAEQGCLSILAAMSGTLDLEESSSSGSSSSQSSNSSS